MEDLHKYYKDLEDRGYITKDGKPIKCQYCENTSFDYIDEHYESVGLVEKTLICSKCHKFVGHWAYGNWTIG